MAPKITQQMKDSLLEEQKRLKEELAEIATQNPKNNTDWDANFPNLGDKEDENAEEVASFITNLPLNAFSKPARDI